MWAAHKCEHLEDAGTRARLKRGRYYMLVLVGDKLYKLSAAPVPPYHFLPDFYERMQHQLLNQMTIVKKVS